MGRALSLSLIYIPSSLRSGYHGSKELDSNNATEGWSLWREERADRICNRARQGVDGTQSDTYAAVPLSPAAATHTSTDTLHNQSTVNIFVYSYWENTDP